MPGGDILGNKEIGISNLFKISELHCFLVGSYSWLVLAFVNSAVFIPVNQKFIRSGINNRVLALWICERGDDFSAYNW